MITHQITSLAGWYQVVETRTDGTVAPIGNFRTEADARDWLATYLRMQTGAEVFKVGYSMLPVGALPIPASADTEAPVSVPEAN